MWCQAGARRTSPTRTATGASTSRSTGSPASARSPCCAFPSSRARTAPRSLPFCRCSTRPCPLKRRPKPPRPRQAPTPKPRPAAPAVAAPFLGRGQRPTARRAGLPSRSRPTASPHLARPPSGQRSQTASRQTLPAAIGIPTSVAAAPSAATMARAGTAPGAWSAPRRQSPSPGASSCPSAPETRSCSRAWADSWGRRWWRLSRRSRWTIATASQPRGAQGRKPSRAM
mmetsp:Transcript_18814/g.71651  ORF Transcript_18814/g.71651 Transcript_18814/m.71651 type:complete len:228 (-) Transcript_18814:1548-2231(-)